MTDPDPRGASARDLLLPDFDEMLPAKLRRVRAARADSTIDEQAVQVISGCIQLGLESRRRIKAALRLVGFKDAEIERALDRPGGRDSLGWILRRTKKGRYYMAHPDGFAAWMAASISSGTYTTGPSPISIVKALSSNPPT